MKRVFLYFLIAFICGVSYLYFQYKQTHLKSYHRNGQLHVDQRLDFIPYLRGQKTGVRRIYNPKGILVEEYSLLNNKPHGPSKTWYPNGGIRSIDNWKHGGLHGDIQRFREDGNFFSKNKFLDGKMNGLSVFYYPDGSVKSEQMMNNDMRNGLSKFYDEDGLLFEESYWIGTDLHGTLKSYFPNGEIKHKKLYVEGKMQGVQYWYREDGSMRSWVDYFQGKKHGEGRYFRKDGATYHIAHYQEGKAQGKQFWYYDSGKVKVEGVMEQGEFHGERIEYWMNGSVKEVGIYQNDKLNGTDKEYYKFSDQVNLERNFDEGNMIGQYTVYDIDGDVLIDMTLGKEGVTAVNSVALDEEIIRSSIADWYYRGRMASLIRALFHAGSYKELELFANTVYADKEWRSLAYPMIFSAIPARFGRFKASDSKQELWDKLDEWRRQYPNSMHVELVRAAAQIKIAWAYRGGDYSRSVTTSSHIRFKDALMEAEKIIHVLAAKNPNNPHIYAEWLTMLMGLGRGSSAMYEVFLKGQSVDDSYFDLYSKMSYGYLLRWYGKPGELEIFFRNSTRNLTEHDRKIISAKLLRAIQAYAPNKFFEAYKFDPEEVMDLVYYYVSHYPEDTNSKNFYAWLTGQYRDKVRARTAFEFLDNHADLDWWESNEAYYETLAWALSDNEPAPLTDIHLAIRSDNLVDTYLYIKNGNDINAKDSDGNTLLHLALRKNKWKLAKLLISSGADLSIRNDDKRYPIHIAVIEGATHLVELMIEYETPLNILDRWRRTPLHYAADKGFRRITYQLLEAEPELLNKRDSKDKTPAICACENGQTAFLKMLQAYGDVEWGAADKDGYRCIHYAVRKGAFDSVEFLLENNLADPNGRDNKDGFSPLEIAEKAGLDRIVQLLHRQSEASKSELPVFAE